MYQSLKKQWAGWVTLTLLILSGNATAQTTVAISNVTAESPVHFANTDDFSAGTLTVTFTMNSGHTTAKVAIDLATGIEYIPSSVTVLGGSATVAQAAGHTASKPRFTVTATSGSNITLAIKRKVSKAALGALDNLKDKVVLTIGGVDSDAFYNNPAYDLKRPTLTVQLPETTHSDALGTHTKTFTIRNTGYGTVKDVYFSVNYPTDVVGNGFWYGTTKLNPIVIGGKTVYKVPNVHLSYNQTVTINENYTVKKCTTGRQINYEAHWGTATEIFETNTNAKNISVSTGIPIITHSSNSAFNYFKWKDGFCGNVLGTYYVRFDNETADLKGTAYNVEVQLFDGDPTIGFSFFEPVNIRLVATDGTEIPIAATGTGNTRFIKFSDLAAVSNASLGTQNVGFTDEDGDGFRDDLKKGAYFQIAFDLKKKQDFKCLQPEKGPKNYFSLQPRAYVLYDNVCKGGRDKSDLRLIDYGTMRIYFNGVSDASKLPAQLVENVPSAGYISPGINWPSLGIHQRLKNESTLSDNARQFKYVVTTPPGVKLQNVKLYKRTNLFGASTETPTSQPDIAPSTTVTITTSNTPTYRDLTAGYLSFDALLENCNGRSQVPITYSVYLMIKNGDGTYCDMPLVCGQSTEIPTVCTAPCTLQAPSLISTIVERADNSYGWTDYTMTTRRNRSEVSPLERMRALYLDDLEFISKGKQHDSKSANNLFYYVKVEKTAELDPKKITLKVNGGAEQTLMASATNPVKGTNAAGKKFFRWDLTSLLPTGTLPAGATFTAVATYQVKNSNPFNYSERAVDIQSGIESFFYTLDNPATDTAISPEGYHTAEKHCGPSLTPIFYIAETQSMLATNEYKEFLGCKSVELGSNLIYAARRFKPGGTYFSQEFRPARLTKKITIKMPSAYQITNIKYTYTYKIAEAAKEATVDMSRLTVTDDGTWKTYTYINPPKGTTGHLPPGMITVVNDYNEYLKVFIQPSCKAKTVDGNKTFWDQGVDAKAMNEIISSNIEYEDYYYHYAETTDSAPATDYLNDRPILFAESKKPDITLEAVSQLTVKATKRTMESIIKVENRKDNDAPYGWVSIPDVMGLEVVSLSEFNNATKAHIHTYTAQTSVSGEKMFFLSEAGNDGKIAKNSTRYFKINYKITNCNTNNLQMKVYAGWNCWGNPTAGYQSTCSEKSTTFSITIAKSKKEIAADPSNPGYNDPNKVGSIKMCEKTAYAYTINSADEGDIYDAKLVVTQAPGITFHDIEVEYPLGSGTKYQVGTGAGKIKHTISGNRHTFDISSILPDGSLPGSLREPVNANKRQFKLTFKVQPDCNFSAGSSFEIDIEGNNLCGNSASGDKTRAIIAGIKDVNINKYSITLDPLTYVSGNGSLCGGGIGYKTRVMVVSADPTFQVGNNARLKFTIPEGYELSPSYAIYGNRTPHGPAAPWANPVRQQSEERTLASGSELVMNIPAGMKNGQFFEFGINIIQKANALIACDAPKNLKVFATDTVTGVTCSTATPTCPSLTVATALEKTVEIKNERPELSFSNVKVNSKALSGKEELTVKYKITNAATASATLNGKSVVANLYYDVNNNGLIDAGDTLVATHTTAALTLGKGITSAEQTFTHLTDASQVCRLLLVLKNENNVCLCGDVTSMLLAPTPIEGLTQSFTTCETNSLPITYPAAAATYAGYSWTAISPAGANAYLSATNIATPTFLYNGAKLNSTLTVTYAFKVKRNHGCEATQTVTVVVSPQKIQLTPPAPLVVSCNNTAAINTWLGTATATNSCGNVINITNDYNTVKPTDLCNAPNGGVVTVTFTAKDPRGNTVTKTATITLISVTAANDTFTITHGATATTTTKTVLDNDKVGTQTATTSTVSMTVVTPATGAAGSATPTLNSNGTITVPAGTKSGTYQIGYKICKTVAAVTVCDTATATVVVGSTTITATPDVVTVTVGGTSSSVLDNDKIGTSTATTSTVSVTVVNPALPKSAGSATPTLDSNGKITVPNNTPAGTYTIVYRICEKLNPSNCSSATATVVVPQTPITATPDVVTVTVGGTSTSSVLDNDKIGTATATTSTVSVTVVTPALPKSAGSATPTLDSNGKITVPNNTPAGTYTIVYRICERLNPSNCSSATATVVVPQTPITATPDVVTVTVGGTSTSSVLDNDKIGTATATTSTVSVTVVTPALPKSAGSATPTLDSNGKITVPNNTPAGTYTIVYRICEKLNPSNCSSATATVVVPAAPITATPDVVTVTVGGTSTSSVLDNDKIGTATATTSTVSVTVVTPALPKSAGSATPTLDSNGKITVPNNTPAGTYTIVYRICEKLNPSNCSSATATVVVPAPPIKAEEDTFTITTGTSTSSVLDNDKIGTATATTSTVSVTVVTPALPKSAGSATPTLDSNGKITVPNNTPAGTYTIVYRICEKLNPSNCSSATATVVVPQTPITATPDVVTVTVGGTSTSSVLDNDKIGTATATTSTVSVTVVTPALPKSSGSATPTLDSNGKITVPNNTPAGTYTIVYRICEKLNPSNCSSATATVVVPAAPIEVKHDDFVITNGATGGTTSNVLTNDKFNGQTGLVGNTSITLTWGNLPSGLQTTTTVGELKVPAGTPQGIYTTTYTICENLNLDNCSTTTVTVAVGTSLIVAHDDTFPIANGAEGGTTSSVLENDSFNGVTPPTNGTVSLTWMNIPAGLQTNTNGKITVPANTPAGIYTVTYRICEVLNPSNCSSATATVVVGAATITAKEDTFTITTGTSTSSVLDNDKIGTATATTSTVSVTVVTPALPKSAGSATPTLDSNGKITVPNNTPAGTYTIVYRICEKLNPSNCSSATATVVVPAPPTVTPTITAVGDTFTVTPTSTTTPTTGGNVLTNDKIGTNTPTVASVTVHTATPTTPTEPYIDPSTGNVLIPAGTPSGTYTMTYYLCERTNSSNCSSATTVTVTVVGTQTPSVVTPTITAVGDTFTVTPTSTTTPTTGGNVLTNDKIGIDTPTVASVTVHTATPTTLTEPYIDPSTGNVLIPAGTPSGTYTTTYYLCERTNSSNCSSATTVTVTVVGTQTPSVITPTITAVGDTFTVTPTSTTTPTTGGNVLTNDKIGTDTPTVASVTVHTATPTTPTEPYIDPSTGNVLIPAGTPNGTYTMTYYLCERTNSSNCSSATTVTVTVVGTQTPSVVTPTITAVGDTFTVTPTSTTTPTTGGNVLTNDKIGTNTPTVASVTVHTATPTTPTEPYIDPSTGNVLIPAGTPSGTYTMTYYLCERTNSSNCSSATTVTVTVVGTQTPSVATQTIEAIDDSFEQNGVPTQTTAIGNVLTNDKLNGNLTPSVQSVTISTPSAPNAHTPYIQPGTGEVLVPAGTPAGTYTLTYTLCSLATPTVCSTATAVVTVNSIEAHNDGKTLIGTTTGGTVSSVLTNDRLNGHMPTTSEVTLHWDSPAVTGFTYKPDGTIEVAAGTPVGVYTVTYHLCATTTPTLCSTPASLVVEVTAAVPVPPLSIKANYDGPIEVESTIGATLSSVLDNDTLDGAPVTTGTVSLTWDTTAPLGFVLNADGTVLVLSNTPAGRYEIPYTICAKNGTLCSSTQLVVNVVTPTVTPTIEVTGETFTYTGTPKVGNVLTNEKLNGVPNPSVRSVTISILPPPLGAYEPYLDPSTGDVIVPTGVPTGTYTITYRVCTIDTPVACDTAQVVVVVPETSTQTPTLPVAVDDTVETVRNTPVRVNVMANDTPRGATTPNVVTAPQNGTTTVNADGSITYTPNNGFVGSDSFVYELCNAEGCASATVKVEVANKLIPYNGMSINGDGQNDYFHIGGIENYPDNVVRIYNRWGVEVFNTNGYDNATNAFRGLSTGRVTIEAPDLLPQGTYYFIIEYTNENNQHQKQVGWLYLKR